jgi:hypothetical protein
LAIVLSVLYLRLLIIPFGIFKLFKEQILAIQFAIFGYVVGSIL